MFGVEFYIITVHIKNVILTRVKNQSNWLVFQWRWQKKIVVINFLFLFFPLYPSHPLTQDNVWKQLHVFFFQKSHNFSYNFISLMCRNAGKSLMVSFCSLMQIIFEWCNQFLTETWFRQTEWKKNTLLKWPLTSYLCQLFHVYRTSFMFIFFFFWFKQRRMGGTRTEEWWKVIINNLMLNSFFVNIFPSHINNSVNTCFNRSLTCVKCH